ncbi:UNKNOWN [Stylonychia lemnae]|uniref:Transmembrane protein n=1 Tax=Stylonychia lemnae TaxID=5949 RepID=A0A078B5T7_STYLE|nr:UNKNOWN [Stylonychia lemnae]|eukprot:CDW89581.1 UNKNOWN [Stylonychia lemnae]
MMNGVIGLTSCDQNSQCAYGCCSQSANFCIYNGTCKDALPGWAIFLIIFVSSISLAIIIVICISCVGFKKKNRAMLLKQQQLQKLRENQPERQFGDMGGFSLNQKGNNYYFQYPSTFVFPREAQNVQQPIIEAQKERLISEDIEEEEEKSMLI